MSYADTMSETAASNVAVANLFIGCPNCNKKVQIYHLHWSAVICQKCDTILHNSHDAQEVIESE